MQLDQMFPGEDGAQFIAHLVDGALPRLRLELLTYVLLLFNGINPGQGEGTPHPQASSSNACTFPDPFEAC